MVTARRHIPAPCGLGSRRGMLFVEYIIALIVFATVFSAALTFVSACGRTVRETYEQVAATEIASSVVEMVRALGPDEVDKRMRRGTLPALASTKRLRGCACEIACTPAGDLRRVSVTVRWKSAGGRARTAHLDTVVRGRNGNGS